MSLFQCENCGCCENTALTHLGRTYQGREDSFDWTGKEHLKGMRLCSACSPTHFSDGTKCSKAGGWHGKFKRVYLPKGQFITNSRGDLQHTVSGSTRFYDYAIPEEIVNKDNLIAWLLTEETGLSSCAIAAHFTGNAQEYEDMQFHPRDVGDFGRCVRLLDVVPEWRERIQEMSVYSEQWKALAKEWSRLEESYATEDKTYLKTVLAEL